MKVHMARTQEGAWTYRTFCDSSLTAWLARIVWDWKLVTCKRCLAARRR